MNGTEGQLANLRSWIREINEHRREGGSLTDKFPAVGDRDQVFHHDLPALLRGCWCDAPLLNKELEFYQDQIMWAPTELAATFYEERWWELWTERQRLYALVGELAYLWRLDNPDWRPLEPFGKAFATTNTVMATVRMVYDEAPIARLSEYVLTLPNMGPVPG